jgi:hypothetical protein
MLIWVGEVIRDGRCSPMPAEGLVVDWGAKEVVRRWKCPIVFDDAYGPEEHGRWSYGTRQAVRVRKSLFVSTGAGIVELDYATLEERRRFSHNMWWGGHCLLRAYGDLLMHESEALDALITMTTRGEIMGILRMRNLKPVVEELGMHLGDPEIGDCRKLTGRTADVQKYEEGLLDQLHINSLQRFDGRLYVGGCGKNAMWEADPTSHVILQDDALDAPHDFTIVGGDRIVVNDSRHGSVAVYCRESAERILTVDIPPVSGAYNVYPDVALNWTRGMVVLDDARVVVGTSPLALFEVDVRRGEVVGSMVLSRDARRSCHGLSILEV